MLLQYEKNPTWIKTYQVKLNRPCGNKWKKRASPKACKEVLKNEVKQLFLSSLSFYLTYGYCLFYKPWAWVIREISILIISLFLSQGCSCLRIVIRYNSKTFTLFSVALFNRIVVCKICSSVWMRLVNKHVEVWLIPSSSSWEFQTIFFLPWASLMLFSSFRSTKKIGLTMISCCTDWVYFWRGMIIIFHFHQ